MKKLYAILLIAVSSVSVHAQNIQGTMETWANYSVGFPIPSISLEKPAGWKGADSLICTLGPLLTGGSGVFTKQLYKTTDKHAGTFAAMIMTKTEDTLGSTPGILTNATIGFDMSNFNATMTGGLPVTDRLGNVSAWVKYLPKGGDSASITVLAVITGAGAGGTDSIVGTGYMSIGATPNYTNVNVPVVYTDTTAATIPNALQITFMSSDGNSTTDSSMLFVDDVTASKFPSGIKIPLFSGEEVKCYPNPTTGIINLASTYDETLTWQAVNMKGQVVASKTFNGNAKADVSNLSSGMYFYNIVNSDGAVIQRGKFNLAK